MDKIEIKVLDESETPGGTMMFLAQLTQRGHAISTMDDLLNLYYKCRVTKRASPKTIERIAALPHGTIKRFTPITVAIVGASRRFLAQIRTHQVGLNYVSASLQYSNYSGKGSFVVPYELMGPDDYIAKDWYLKSCKDSMQTYTRLIKEGIDNDTAGYAAPQGLRNILIMQGNHEAWMHLIRLRTCKRNTPETAYVKLGWALTQKGDVKKLMQTNIAGEITERSLDKEFLY